METDKEKFCSDLILGGYIEQILRVPLYDVPDDRPPVTDYILWDLRVPAGRNIIGDLQSIFFVKIRGLALNAVRNIYAHDYVKIKAKVFAPGIMGGEKRFMSFFYAHWGDDRFEIVIDNPEQILDHEVMKVDSQNESH